jgi:hypothetical protein
MIIYNYLKFVILGIWKWKNIFKFSLKIVLINYNIKKKLYNYFLIQNEIFKKIWKIKTNHFYSKIRFKNTLISTIKSIESWSTNIKYFLNYNIKKNFSNINKRKLIFLILKYIKNYNFYIIINKIFVFQKWKIQPKFSFLFVQFSHVYFISLIVFYFFSY